MDVRFIVTIRLLVIATFATSGLVHPIPAAALPSGVVATEIAGQNLGAYFPHVDYVKAFNVGVGFHVALDPRFLGGVSKNCRIYIVAHKTDAQWNQSPTLVDARSGGFQAATSFGTTSIILNTKAVTNVSQLSGAGGTNLGVGYDAVLDCNSNGTLDSGDYIDTANAEAGLYVVLDTTMSGPYTTTNADYTVQGTAIPQARVYYPSTIGALGTLPLVGLSHGNFYNHTQYSALAKHLASYGYIVMAHGTDTGPGVEAASWSTLEHTLALIGLQATIAGGVLNGHIDSSRIVWLGHSRGGEGVVKAYDRLDNDEYTQLYYDTDDIALISSMSPTGYLSADALNPPPVGDEPSPGTAAYHLWLATADDDVRDHPGIDLNNVSQYHWSRGQDYKQVISMYGAGHRAYTDLSGVQEGPCLLSHADEQKIVKGYAVPLLKRYTDGNIPARDFLWRQWETFRPKGAPAQTTCANNPPYATVNLVYDEPTSAGSYVLDDFESSPSVTLSSAGTTVNYTVQNIAEDALRDKDYAYAWVPSAQDCRCTGLATNIPCGAGYGGHGACDVLDTACDCSGASCVCQPGRHECIPLGNPCASLGGGTCQCSTIIPDPMNGALYTDRARVARGVAFDWSGSTERYWEVNVPVGQRDLRGKYLSFRAAQTPRHPNTVSAIGDLDFSIQLKDNLNQTVTVRISAYGGGIEEPYQRQRQPDEEDPPGWAADFETIRIRLTDFLNKDVTPNSLNLSNIVWIRLRFSGSVGSTPGRIILDDLELNDD